jgi:transposase
MMTKREKMQNSIELVNIENLVPENHLVRKLDKYIDFKFIYKLVEPYYCHDNGRASIDPVILFKITFLSYIFGIRSIRQTIKEIQVNMAYRWFLGLNITDPVPHFSTISKNYVRRFKDTNVFEEIFNEIVHQALKNNLIDAQEFFSDSTHIKANANKKKFNRGHVLKDARKYSREVLNEVNEIREEEGKKPFDDNDNGPKEHEQKISTTDPDSGYMYRENKPEGFFYLDHRTVDGKHNIIIDSYVTPGNVHDSTVYVARQKRITEKFGLKPKAVGLDAGYDTTEIHKYFHDEDIFGVVSYRSPYGKRGIYKKSAFKYIKEEDTYICPQGQRLDYKRVDRTGVKHYTSNPKICLNCPCLKQCTKNQKAIRTITRHIHEEFREETRLRRLSPYGKQLKIRRSETIERSFAEAKELHGLRYARYRGLEKVRMQCWLISACQNMKRIANILFKRDRNLSFSPFNFRFIIQFAV